MSRYPRVFLSLSACHAQKTAGADITAGGLFHRTPLTFVATMDWFGVSLGSTLTQRLDVFSLDESFRPFS